MGDLLIRRPLGRLLKLPDPKECPVENLTCIRMTQENTIYTGYDSNMINMSMRMVAVSNAGSDVIMEKLQQGSEWYKKNVASSVEI